MKKDSHVIIAAMVCITVLEVVALLTGLDGVLFSFVVATVAGLGGYEVGILKSIS